MISSSHAAFQRPSSQGQESALNRSTYGQSSGRTDRWAPAVKAAGKTLPPKHCTDVGIAARPSDWGVSRPQNMHAKDMQTLFSRGENGQRLLGRHDITLSAAVTKGGHCGIPSTMNTHAPARSITAKAKRDLTKTTKLEYVEMWQANSRKPTTKPKKSSFDVDQCYGTGRATTATPSGGKRKGSPKKPVTKGIGSTLYGLM